MPVLLLIACAVACAYQLTAIIACLAHLRRRDPAPANTPAVSILKPIHGLDPDFYAAIRSHAAQDYPDFEILFGVAGAAEPAVADIERLAAAFPRLPIRLVQATTRAANGKVGVLADLAAQARHAILLVNDSDIRVPDGYLRAVVAPLDDPRVGIVTCLYRASAHTLPGRFEALGIATDFAPSALVAPLVGVREFGLGSTLVFRRADLERIGGFPAIAAYLADDYQLARRITSLGLRAHLSRVVVTTSLQAATWREVWHHQVRWHRTIRVSRGGYAGLPVTHAAFWALLAAVAGFGWAAAVLLAARMAMALVAGLGVLRCPITARWFWLVPFRDLFGVAVWLAGLFGNTVQWRDQRLRLSPDGRIQQPESNR
jgi:ceramide glucosyltransferase